MQVFEFECKMYKGNINFFSYSKALKDTCVKRSEQKEKKCMHRINIYFEFLCALYLETIDSIWVMFKLYNIKNEIKKIV
jgi:hypothetical protein